MSNTKDFFSKKKQWSVYKDNLLASYLLPYFNKIMSTKKPVVYIDGFAGKGKFDDGTIGSPLLVKDLIYKARSNSSYNTRIEAYFIELEFAEELKKNLADRTLNVVCGDYSTQVPIVLNNNFGKNIFLYVDPFGIKYLDFSIFSKLDLSKYNSVELLLNFNSFGFLREGIRLLKLKLNDVKNDALDVERTSNDFKNSIDNMNSIANGDYWQKILQDYSNNKIDIFEAENQFLAKYMDELNKTFNFVCKIPVRYSTSKLAKYQMIFATNNKHGILLMADNMIKCNNEMTLEIRNGQASLFDYEYNSSLYKEHMYNEIPMSFVELKDFYCHIYTKIGFICQTKDMNAYIKELEETGKIEVKRIPAFTKTGKISKSMDFYKNTIKIKR